MTENLYPKGTVLLLEEGEYSNRGYAAHLVTVRDLNLPDAIAAFKALHKDSSEWDQRGPSEFAAWLVAEQWAMPLDFSGVHIGSYGRLEL